MGEAYNEFRNDEDYMWARDTYRVVRCCGCENVSFNIESESSENIRLGEYGEEEYYSEFKSYPIDEGDVHPSNIYDMPLRVSNAFRESVIALNNKCYLLATIGFRTTVEAFCREQGINGSLVAMINEMNKKGLITNYDKTRLHILRQCGNDSTHEMTSLGHEQLLAAFEVIQNILNSNYTITQKFKKILEYKLQSVRDLIEHIDNNLDDHQIGEVLYLRGFLQPDCRYSKYELDKYELELINMIDTGTYDKLIKEGLPEDGSKQKYKLVKKE